jgi:hypothetical protein
VDQSWPGSVLASLGQLQRLKQLQVCTAAAALDHKHRFLPSFLSKGPARTVLDLGVTCFSQNMLLQLQQVPGIASSDLLSWNSLCKWLLCRQLSRNCFQR